MKSLHIPIAVVLTNADSARVNEQADQLVDRIRGSAAELQKLLLDCVSLVNATQEQQDAIATMGALKRVWFALTGGKEMAAEQRQTAQALHGAMRILAQVREQQLLTVELITLVDSKLRWLQPRVQEAMETARTALVAFFDEARQELVNRDERIDQVQRSTALQTWLHRLGLQRFEGVDYLDLEPVGRSLCAVSDFFRVSGGQWTSGDLSLLRQALHELGLKGRDRITAAAYFTAMVCAPRLLAHLLEGIDVTRAVPPEPEHLPFLAGTLKLQRLDAEEAYLIDTIAAALQSRSIPCDRTELHIALVQEYLQDAGIAWDAEISPFGLAVEVLSGLKLLQEPSEAPTAVVAAPPEPELMPLTAITVRELAQHMGVEPKVLVTALRLAGRLEREEGQIPLPVAGAMAREHEVELRLAEVPEAPVDPMAAFEWLKVTEPVEGMLPGHIPTDGKPLADFTISAAPVTRHQFIAALQRLMDRYAFKVGTNTLEEWKRTKLWINDGVLWLQPAGAFANRDEVHKEQPEHSAWARWLFLLTQSARERLAYRRDSSYNYSAAYVEVPLLYVKPAGIRLEGARFVADPAEEEKPVTGVTRYGALLFIDQLERAGYGAFTLPSARHYAALNRGLSSLRVPVREWCAEEVLLAGVNQYDAAASDASLADTGLRLVRKGATTR